jgi:putative addiction module component (TIGR02574 family)
VQLGLNFGGNAMSPQLDLLTDQALALSPEDRLTLAQRLWQSVGPPVEDEEIDPELIAEIERRDAEIESGAVKPIPYDQAMREIRESLK